MNAVIDNILEAAGIGKRRQSGGICIALLVSLAIHFLLLASGAGSAVQTSASGTPNPRSKPQVFAYVPLTPNLDVADQPPVPAVFIAPSRLQKPATAEPGIVPISTPDELYFRAKSLERRPSPIGSLAFSPPVMGAAAKAIELKIRVFVNEYGTVDFVRIEGDSPGSEFTDPVIDTLKKSRFSPGQLNGENVKSQIVLGWKFITESNE